MITITSAVALVARAGTGVAPDWGGRRPHRRRRGRRRRRRPRRGPDRHPPALRRLHRPRARRRGLHRRPGPPRARLTRLPPHTPRTERPCHDVDGHPPPRRRTHRPPTPTPRATDPAPSAGSACGSPTTHGSPPCVWLLLIVGLGAFAPKVEANLSGAGWQADGSESVAVRELAQDHFGGNASSAIQVVVHSHRRPRHRGRRRRRCSPRPPPCSRTSPASPTSSHPSPAPP